VLLYHNVGPRPRAARQSLSIAPCRFERHLVWLARNGFTTVTASAWLAGVRPRRAIMITFDDGYADLAHHALPVLARHGMTATVFVVTGMLGGQDEWNDAMGGDRLDLLSEADLVYWKGRGIEFGSHGRTHRDLVLLDPDIQALEIEGSRADLARILGTDPVAIAYPFGSYDARVVEAARKCYALGFTIREGMHREPADPLCVARLQVQPRDGTFDLFLNVTFGSSLWNHLKGRLVRLRQRLLMRV
jgi:peptidoglycan/xylan/chitin deacetylase (PgdA/CDA1 family)